MEKEITGDKVIAVRFTEAKEHYGDVIVSAVMDGEYDKTNVPDPLILTHYWGDDPGPPLASGLAVPPSPAPLLAGLQAAATDRRSVGGVPTAVNARRKLPARVG